MKKLLKYLNLLLVYTLLVSCTKSEAEPKNQPAQTTKQTTVYIVRHAEKSSNNLDDPDLSAAGKERAKALKTVLQDKNIAAIYSTDYKRTRQTAEPLAQAKNITIQTYYPGELNSLAEKILKENRNQSVLIVGHSNTVLETIEAFKAQRPVSQLSETDYKYLFTVTIPENGPAKAEVQRYGK